MPNALHGLNFINDNSFPAREVLSTLLGNRLYYVIAFGRPPRKEREREKERTSDIEQMIRIALELVTRSKLRCF